jgi:hypothetical protein
MLCPGLRIELPRRGRSKCSRLISQRYAHAREQGQPASASLQTRFVASHGSHRVLTRTVATDRPASRLPPPVSTVFVQPCRPDTQDAALVHSVRRIPASFHEAGHGFFSPSDVHCSIVYCIPHSAHQPLHRAISKPSPRSIAPVCLHRHRDGSTLLILTHCAHPPDTYQPPLSVIYSPLLVAYTLPLLCFGVCSPIEKKTRPRPSPSERRYQSWKEERHWLARIVPVLLLIKHCLRAPCTPCKQAT